MFSAPARLVVACAFASLAALSANAQSGDKPVVFVTDITGTTPPLMQAGSALTTSLCGQMAKDKRIEVLCAPDVKQIMGFAAMGALTGASSPAVTSLEDRLAKVSWVVSGVLSPNGKDFSLVLSTGPRAADADPHAPAFEKATLRLEEVASGSTARLMDRLPEMASRLAKATVPAPVEATQPPKPLAPKKS
jgi:hypothetical protein